MCCLWSGSFQRPPGIHICVSASTLTQSLDASNTALRSRVMKSSHPHHGKVWFIDICSTLQGDQNTVWIVVVDSSMQEGLERTSTWQHMAWQVMDSEREKPRGGREFVVTRSAITVRDQQGDPCFSGKKNGECGLMHQNISPSSLTNPLPALVPPPRIPSSKGNLMQPTLVAPGSLGSANCKPE